MMIVTENQPDGTPTWIDLGIPDLDRAMEFYGALFGWQFDVGPAEFGRYTTCRTSTAAGSPRWRRTTTRTRRVLVERLPGHRRLRRHRRCGRAAGGTVVDPPADVMDQGRMATVRDPAGASSASGRAGAHRL